MERKSFNELLKEKELLENKQHQDDGHLALDDAKRVKVLSPGQLVFMLAAMGHGQSAEQRFAGILNIVFASLRDEDRDYVEARLLSRDPKDRKFHETLEGVFEFLTEEWFATPTEQPSDSAE